MSSVQIEVFWVTVLKMRGECSAFHLRGLIRLLGEFGGGGEELTPLYSANGPAMDTLALQLHHPR